MAKGPKWKSLLFMTANKKTRTKICGANRVICPSLPLNYLFFHLRVIQHCNVPSPIYQHVLGLDFTLIFGLLWSVMLPLIHQQYKLQFRILPNLTISKGRKHKISLTFVPSACCQFPWISSTGDLIDFPRLASAERESARSDWRRAELTFSLFRALRATRSQWGGRDLGWNWLLTSSSNRSRRTKLSPLQSDGMNVRNAFYYPSHFLRKWTKA